MERIQARLKAARALPVCKKAISFIPFPFSDLSGRKRRPAVVLAGLNGDDCIVRQITGKNRFDPLAIPLAAADFSSGRLPVDRLIAAFCRYALVWGTKTGGCGVDVKIYRLIRQEETE
jgi:hypothetical protein